MACKTFHKGKYYVSLKRGFEDCKKDVIVTIDKLFESDSLRVSLSDDDDPIFLYILTVTRCDYEDLKKQQGLLIDFDNFPSQLVRLLQQCASNNMFLILKQMNPLQYLFEIVEHNEFKRLIHLSLKTSPASDADIKLHMSSTIGMLKRTLANLKSNSSSNEAILNDKCLNLERKVQDLSHAISKMEEDKLRQEREHHELLKQEKEKFVQERLQWQTSTELTAKTQMATTTENLNKKDRQIDELNSKLRHLKDNISSLENQLSEKSQRLHLLENEVQKSHIEVATLKAKNATLEREIMEKEKNYTQLNTRCMQLEKFVSDNTDTIKDLNNSINLLKKEKCCIEERLAKSESLANKNNEAVHSSSEQLLKANQIISKQNSDLIEMKEKLLCRTAIALEQEKVIEGNTKEIDGLRADILETKQYLQKVNDELSALKEKCELNEMALKDKDEIIKNNNMVIQWLHKKMENSCAPNDALHSKSSSQMANSSTPYFVARNSKSNSSEAVSDESINFYATSKLSNVDQSPISQDSSPRIGLDPKYLQPAKSDIPARHGKDSAKPTGSQQSHKGKENKNINLPKVDYREKKSARGDTYRATPVSAYFP